MIIKNNKIVLSKIYNVAGNQINPATQETLDNVKIAIETLEGITATSNNQTTEIAYLNAILSQLDVALSTRLADATFTGHIGEVQASPTAYTVLQRLKDIQDKLSSFQDVSGSGSLSALNQAVTLSNIFSKATVSILIAGTFTASLKLEASMDGSTWIQLPFLDARFYYPYPDTISII